MISLCWAAIWDMALVCSCLRLDPTDPIGRLLYNVLAMVAEFEADLIRVPTKTSAHN